MRDLQFVQSSEQITIQDHFWNVVWSIGVPIGLAILIAPLLVYILVNEVILERLK